MGKGKGKKNGNKKMELIIVQGKEAIKGREKNATKRRAAKGTREGITRKREEATRKMAKKAARRMRRKVIKPRKMITTQARKKDEAERIRSCCPSSFTINSGASTWPWNRL